MKDAHGVAAAVDVLIDGLIGKIEVVDIDLLPCEAGHAERIVNDVEGFYIFVTSQKGFPVCVELYSLNRKLLRIAGYVGAAIHF